MTMEAHGKTIGAIYFLKPIGLDGPIKIGFSHWPERRLAQYMSWSPLPLEMIGFVSAKPEAELFLHRCFFDVHSHCEWFHPSPLLRETIETILATGSIDAVRHLPSKGHHRSGTRGPYMTIRRIREAQARDAQGGSA